MLLDGVNHVAILTKDTDRFVKFYAEVFDASVSHEERNGPLRLTLVDIGARNEINLFEIDDNAEADHQVPMFERGRIDHIGLQAASKEAFLEIRRRLIARGAADTFVTDFGRAHSIFFRDPDGLEGEVLLWLGNDATVNPPGTPAAGYDDV